MSPSEPTLGQLLEPTGLPDLLNSTPSELLTQLGSGELPALPSLPALPELALPAMPALDPTGLIAPITDLMGSFGHGQLPGGTNDPVGMLTGLAGTLESGMTTGAQALRALDGLWEGAGGTAAVGKSMEANGNAQELAAQGTALAGDVQIAAGIVGAGLATLQGIAVKTAGLLAATMPVIATPPGQAAALGIAADGLGEALAAVSATQAELAAPTAAATAHGAPVPVTAPPSSMLSQAADLLEGAAPLVGSFAQYASLLTGASGTVDPGLAAASAPAAAMPTTPTAMPMPTAPMPTGQAGTPTTPLTEYPTVGGGGGHGATQAMFDSPQLDLAAHPASAEPEVATQDVPDTPGWAQPAGSEDLIESTLDSTEGEEENPWQTME